MEGNQLIQKNANCTRYCDHTTQYMWLKRNDHSPKMSAIGIPLWIYYQTTAAYSLPNVPLNCISLQSRKVSHLITVPGVKSDKKPSRSHKYSVSKRNHSRKISILRTKLLKTRPQLYYMISSFFMKYSYLRYTMWAGCGC